MLYNLVSFFFLSKIILSYITALTKQSCLENYRRIGSVLRTSFHPASPMLKATPEMLASDEEDEIESEVDIEDNKRKDRIGKSGELKVKEKSDSLSRPAYVPTHLPPFPSKHSYKKTPVIIIKNVWCFCKLKRKTFEFQRVCYN
jgi:hypothetical protein